MIHIWSAVPCLNSVTLLLWHTVLVRPIYIRSNQLDANAHHKCLGAFITQLLLCIDEAPEDPCCILWELTFTFLPFPCQKHRKRALLCLPLLCRCLLLSTNSSHRTVSSERIIVEEGKGVEACLTRGHLLDFLKAHCFSFCEAIVDRLYFVHICCVCIVEVRLKWYKFYISIK